MELANISSECESPLRKIDHADLSMTTYDDSTNDDQAESVDSGCVPDLTPETSWLQVSSALKYEYNFVTSLMQHTSQSKSDVTSVSQNKSDISSASTSTEDRQRNKHKDSKKELTTKNVKKVDINKNKSVIENVKNIPHFNVGQKKRLEDELRRLKKGSVKNLSSSQVKTRESKIKKQLLVMEKRRERANKKLKKEQNAVANMVASVTKSTTTNPVSSNMKFKAANTVSSNMKATNKKIYNKSGKLVYSKFDFTDNSEDRWRTPKRLDLNSMMNKVIKEKEKIESLATQGKVKEASEHLEKKLWDTAMRRAQGEKVRDDSRKLKKSLDRRKQQKRKSQRQWTERIETGKKFQEMRRDQKIQNVISRKQKQQERSKGKKRKGKRGSRVPGF